MSTTTSSAIPPSIMRPRSQRRYMRWCALWDHRGAELLNAALSTTFGAWLLMPWDSFGECPAAYHVMKVVGGSLWRSNPELLWGTLFMGIGLLKIGVLWRDHLQGRKWASLVSGSLWVTAAATVGFTNYEAPMFPLYCLFALNMYRVFLCIRVPNRHIHESASGRKG